MNNSVHAKDRADATDEAHAGKGNKSPSGALRENAGTILIANGGDAI